VPVAEADVRFDAHSGLKSDVARGTEKCQNRSHAIQQTAAYSITSLTRQMRSTGLRQLLVIFFSSRRRHTSSKRVWSSDVCSSDLYVGTHARARIGIALHRHWIDVSRCGVGRD